MRAVSDPEQISPPVTYEDWLNCFDVLRLDSSVDNNVAMTIANGSFVNRGYIADRFQEKLAETINEMIDKRVSRFLRELDMIISFNELSSIVPLFVKLRNEINKCLFFSDFHFLDEDIKNELEQSVKMQTEQFWSDIMSHLQKQAVIYSNDELDDSLLLIRRINLFA
jgi:hypothetical protein